MITLFYLPESEFENHITEWITDLYLDSRDMKVEVSSVICWFQYIRSLKSTMKQSLYRYLTFYLCDNFDLYLEHLPSRTDIFGTSQMFDEWVDRNIENLMSLNPPEVIKEAIGYILLDIRMSQYIKCIENTHQINIMKLFLFKTIVNYYKYHEIKASTSRKRPRVSDSESIAVAVSPPIAVSPPSHENQA